MKASHFDLVLKLSLLFLLMFSGVYWFTRIPLATLAISGFIWNRIIYKRIFWFTAFCFVLFEVILFWYEADNHKYLTAYWFLSLAMLVEQPNEIRRNSLLAFHGRAYLVLAMAFAVLWKCINTDFTGHDFFEYTLLTDDRFQYFTHYLTQLPFDALKSNQAKEAEIFLMAENSIPLMKNLGVSWLAQFMTYFTIFIEASIAIGFLLAPRSVLSHMALMTFILVTYPVASVIGFAWLLILFAVTQCEGLGRYTTAYCILFVMTQAFRSEFGPLFEFLLGQV